MISKAKEQLAEDMRSRDIAAIIWNVGEAGFHFIPEIVTGQDKDGADITARVTGLYVYDNTLYAIEEDAHGTDMKHFYKEGVDVPPVVVTLTPDMASKILGDPTNEKGFTTDGSNNEWLVIADCYFEALNEK